MAIYLGLLSPTASSNLPGSRRAALCFLFGLASDGVYRALPVTRQAVVSYTAFPPLLHAAAVYFCCTFLGVASTRRYLASCPVKPGLSSPTAFRYRGSGHLPYSKPRRPVHESTGSNRNHSNHSLAYHNSFPLSNALAFMIAFNSR